MPREFSRGRRVAEQVRRELPDLIRETLRDPRLGMVTVSDVELSRDLAHAKVFVTVMNTGESPAQNIEILNRAAGHLRHGLGQRMMIRNVPQLHFHYDSSLDYGSRMSKLIHDAIESDSHAPNRDDSSTDK
jgi:ribosome-binding factor A